MPDQPTTTLLPYLLHVIVPSQQLALLSQGLGLTLLNLCKPCPVSQLLAPMKQSNRKTRGINLLLSRLPLQTMHLFSRLPHRVLGYKQGTIRISLRRFSIHETLFRRRNARVTRAAAKHSRCAFRGASSVVCGSCAAGGATVAGVAVRRR